MTLDSLVRARALLVERLRGRWPEIEQAVIVRVYSISDPSYIQDPGYVEGLRSTVSVALAFGLAAMGQCGGEELPPPAALLAQARLAAKNGVGLATVMRRYAAGYSLLSDYVMQEVERGFSDTEPLHLAARSLAGTFDRVLAAVTAEYTKVSAERADSPAVRRAECVKSLLIGEPADVSVLAYEFEAWHLGLLAVGEEAEPAVRALAGALDRRVLAVQAEAAGTVWGWLGGARRIGSDRVLERARACTPSGVTVAIGEPMRGLVGWRLTHRQALAARAVAARSGERIVRYGDVALLASALKDELLARSLREIYLAPLSDGRDGGKVLRDTLRVYFASGRNVSSAAALLGVKRHTVTYRLRTIEERLGRPLARCAAEVEMALRLDDLAPGSASSPRASPD